ncbi:hypothetical protein [Streptomyces sp. JJ38]|uniref:hypothetical protein n=1 Tax=Streptomyces sp. JJ38 TaxID=2738128 RepID=UPI001C58812E|nr:hypothetical protein [Streptomyces sp. JJ38]MBW1600104.1 hypothetical protein [Streptomyces sp. JJ38]
MAREADTTACEKTPAAIRAALERRPDWLHGFEQDFLSAAAELDQPAMDAALDRWFPAACACVTPGYLDEVENDVRRVRQGDTAGMVFRDAEGNACDADGVPLSFCAGER